MREPPVAAASLARTPSETGAQCSHRVCTDCVAVADSIFAPKAELHELETITLTTRIKARR
jgi:hypothetical protein